MAITVPIETTYDDSGTRAATSDIADAGKEMESAGKRWAGSWSTAGAAIGDAFREGARGVGEATAAAAGVIASGGSIGDAWNAAAGQLATAAQNMVASIAETVIAEKGAAIGTKLWAAAQWLLNAAMSPFFLIPLAIIAIVVAIVVLYKKVGWFRDLVDKALTAVRAAFAAVLDSIKAVWSWLQSNWKTVLVILLGPIAIAVALIAKHWDKIKAGAKAVLDWLRTAWQKASDWLVKPFQVWWDVLSGIIDRVKGAIQSVLDMIGRIKIPHLPDLNPFSSGASVAAVGVPMVGGRAVGGATSNTTLNVSGAVDAEGTAREVQRLLDRHANRQGRAVGAPRRRAW